MFFCVVAKKYFHTSRYEGTSIIRMSLVLVFRYLVPVTTGVIQVPLVSGIGAFQSLMQSLSWEFEALRSSCSFFPCKCQGPAEPTGAVGAGLHFAGLQGLRLGCRPGFLWVFSWNVAGPCWFLCLMLYLLQEGSLFFKLYIYKNRSCTVYIKNLKMIETCMYVLSSIPLYLFVR